MGCSDCCPYRGCKCPCHDIDPDPSDPDGSICECSCCNWEIECSCWCIFIWAIIALICLLTISFLFLYFSSTRHICERLENYACDGLGANIEYANGKTCKPKGCKTILGFPSHCAQVYDSKKILLPGNEGWCFEGSVASVLVKLEQPIYIREISLISGCHLNTCTMDRVVDLKDSIKDFKITGFDKGKKPVFEKDFRLYMRMGQYIHKFPIVHDPLTCPRVLFIKLEINSNWGAKETFISRLSVMGFVEPLNKNDCIKCKS